MYWWDQSLEMETRAMASEKREAVLRQAAQGLIKDLAQTKEKGYGPREKI